MPRRPPIDYQAFADRLCALLAVQGPLPGIALCRALDISQPTLSRIVRLLGDRVVVGGSARRTRYGVRRDLEGLPTAIPIYEAASATRAARLLMTLHPVAPRGFWCEGHVAQAPSLFCPDLPYFLYDLQPAGFLGRLIPLMHPEEGFPRDISIWSANQALRYLTRYGWDLPGALIVGDDAFAHYKEKAATYSAVSVREVEREGRYPEVAASVLSYGVPGSSAGGEQPKFLARSLRADGGAVDVLVKFSPQVVDDASERVADLLLCEHVALNTLQEWGFPSAQSEVIRAGGRVFLEVERFDRVGGQPAARRGVLSLRALDAEFVGLGDGWAAIAQALHGQALIGGETVRRIMWLETFGRLIGNTDMHCGNLSFWVDGLTIGDLTPMYDMTPMRYAPTRAGYMDSAPLRLPEVAGAWPEGVCDAAQAFWERVRDHEGISATMQRLAAQNLSALRSASPTQG